MQITLPNACHHIIELLEKSGYEAFVVGGCVRDMLLGTTPADWDICTNAKPAEMMQVFVGYRVIPTGIAHGTLSILMKGQVYEVTTYRVDGEYKDHRRPESITYTNSLIQDLARRDFTINAMAWHPVKGFVDAFDGLGDLKRRCVKAVGNPHHRFEEDGLRIMRLIRFATVLDFDYDSQTLQAAIDKCTLLQHIAKERIQVELDKILLSAHVARGLGDLSEYGMLKLLVPEMSRCVDFKQGKRHFLDVFEHSILATALVQPKLVLRLTMFLHDVGKPLTLVMEKDQICDFPNHEQVGAELADGILRHLKYDNQTRKTVVALIQHHNDHLILDRRVLRHKLSELGYERLMYLFEVKVADILAHRMYEAREQVQLFFAQLKDMVDAIVADGDPIKIDELALNGQDLLALGYEGKAVGQALNQCLEWVLDDPLANQKENLLSRLVQIK